MADIRITALPNEVAPSGGDFVPIDLATTRRTTVTLLTEAGRPTASQAEAEAGTNPTKAMTPLTTAQAIAFQGGASFVPQARTVTAGVGLDGGGALSGDITLDVDFTAVQAFGDKLAALQALSLTAGDLIRASGLNTFEAIDIASEGQALTVVGGVATWTSLTGTGDVIGPASAVVDNLTSFNNTNGKVVKDSGVPVASMQSAMRGHLFGLTMSNAGGDPTNDITVAAGSCASSDTLPFEMILAAAITKQLDATWAVGNNAGGRMSAAAIANTTYHVFVIRRPDTGVVDVGFDVSATAPTLPANYTQFRRIGSVMRVSAAIRLFSQTGDYFHYTTNVADRSSTAALASSLITLSIPLGIVTAPIMTNGITTGAASSVSTNIGSAAVGAANIAFTSLGSSDQQSQIASGVVFSDTSARIYYSVIIASGTIGVNNLITVGYIDTRGRLA